MKIIKTPEKAVLDSGLAFFDIETTGLSARTSNVYLIGLMRKEGNETVLTQLFCESLGEEKEMLETFVALLKEDDTLIHYNGSTFDIPFLNKKFRQYSIPFEIIPEKTRDLYKELLHFKKYFPTENLKLKTMEAASGFVRRDKYDGAELIKLYSNLLGRIRLASITKKKEDGDNVNSVLGEILLHNSDDIEGLYDIYMRTNIQAALSGFLDIKAEATPFELTIGSTSPLFPLDVELTFSGFNLNNNSNGWELTIPIKEATLKYFFPDYKNYTFVIDRDMCMHNSVVSGISKDNKKKCTKETAYIKKTSRYIPIPATMVDSLGNYGLHLFKESYEDKVLYTEIKENPDFFKEYAKSILNGL